jgi:hypothetical protein
METRTLDPAVANASSFGIFLACQKVANNNRLDPDCIWMTQQGEMKAKSVNCVVPFLDLLSAVLEP